MSNLTKKEVIDLYNEMAQAWNEANPERKCGKKEATSFEEAVRGSQYLNGLPNWELVEEVGGEGEGNHAHHVIKYKGVYYKYDYNYYSYDGCEYEYAVVYKAQPQEKVITVYTREALEK